MHHINSCTNMCKIYGNKDAKNCTTWSFPSYREDEFQWETCWHVFKQIYGVINSSHADTATRVDFTKIVPTKFHLWVRSSQFLIYPLVRRAPVLKENQQLPDADDARCIGSQTDICSCSVEQTLENTLHHPQVRRVQDAWKHSRKK